MNTHSRQLSFHVAQHPRLVERGDDAWLLASLKIALDVSVPHDLNRGDELTVSIADADGTVIAQGLAAVTAVAFADVKDDGRVIGTERQHKAKLIA